MIRRRAGRGIPEHNIVQTPELLRRIKERFQLRQAHVAPALNEGIQLVALVDDLRDTPADRSLALTYRAGASAVADATNFWLGVNLWMPATSRYNAHVTRVFINSDDALRTSIGSVNVDPTGTAQVQLPTDQSNLTPTTSAWSNAGIVATKGTTIRGNSTFGTQAVGGLLGGAAGPLTLAIEFERLVLIPGTGIAVVNQAPVVNTHILQATFEWVEELRS